MSCASQLHFAPQRAPHILRRTRRTAPIRSSPSSNMSIQEYIEEHALGKKVEDVINAAVKAKAAEPISFMVGAITANIRQIGRFRKRRLSRFDGWVGGGDVGDRLGSCLHICYLWYLVCSKPKRIFIVTTRAALGAYPPDLLRRSVELFSQKDNASADAETDASSVSSTHPSNRLST